MKGNILSHVIDMFLYLLNKTIEYKLQTRKIQIYMTCLLSKVSIRYEAQLSWVCVSHDKYKSKFNVSVAAVDKVDKLKQYII